MPRKFEPSAAQRRVVGEMVSFGIPQPNIASVVGVDAKTLRKYFSDEIENGTTRAITKVARSLFRTACGTGPGAITAAIFFLKTRAGWKETAVHEHGGIGGGPIIIIGPDTKL